MDQYYIVNVPGSSGMFLTGVIAKYLGFPCDTIISPNGHCHNLGNGNWKNTDYIELIGDYWQDKVYTKTILFSHYQNLSQVKSLMPNIKIVLIDYDNDDVELISKFRTTKALDMIWNQEEYNKVAGADWPLYSKDNILSSNIIQKELIKFRINDTANWITAIDHNLVDYAIPFKTILGLDNKSLNDAIAHLIGVTPDTLIQTFISQYQTINKEFYKI